jgi:tetratricopeptide (TPR) repeat protein
MERIVHKEFYTIVKIIEDYGLDTPKKQQLFIENKTTLEILEKLIKRFSAKDTYCLSDLLFYKCHALIELGYDKETIKHTARAALQHGKDGRKKDELKIILQLLYPATFSFKKKDFCISKYFEISFIITQIKKGTYSFNRSYGLYEKSLLVKILSMLHFISLQMDEYILRSYVEFISQHGDLFENKETFISFLFRLANRNFNNQGIQWINEAENLIRQYEWSEQLHAKFDINRGSYYERNGDYQQALRYFDRALGRVKNTNNSLNVSLNYHRGVCNFHLQRKTEAKNSFDKCVRKAAEHTKAREYLTALRT